MSKIETFLMESNRRLEPVRQGVLEKEDFSVQGLAVAPEDRENLGKWSTEEGQLWEQLGIKADFGLQYSLENISMHIL